MSPGAKRRPSGSDPLRNYKRKRDFKVTPEPRGRTQTRIAAEPSFVIHKHQASHLHFDLRLEEGGVLKSWAVPKPPPEALGIRRLAVATEDHPLDYKDFEGNIPAGQYGAGRVEIWDKGHFFPRESLPDKRVFALQGRRLRGTFALIKLKPDDEKDKNWLFFKTKSESQE